MTEKPISLIFMGTPEFALPSLEKLASCSAFKIEAIVTQPDKPAGRGQNLKESPVKVLGNKLSIPIFQPPSIKKLTREESLLKGTKKSQELCNFINSLYAAPILISVAYGKIIPPALLNLTDSGVVNVHPSLLPRWRGAAPIQHAIFSGDKETGVCIMKAEEELDTGPVYAREEVTIDPQDTAGTLHDKLAELGGNLLVSCLPKIAQGELSVEAQSEQGVTYAEKWTGEDAQIVWEDPAKRTNCRIRASSPKPGARTSFQGELIKIFRAEVVEDQNFPQMDAGSIVEVNKRELIVQTGAKDFLAIKNMQFPGKKILEIEDILRGRSFTQGDRFV